MVMAVMNVIMVAARFRSPMDLTLLIVRHGLLRSFTLIVADGLTMRNAMDSSRSRTRTISRGLSSCAWQAGVLHGRAPRPASHRAGA